MKKKNIRTMVFIISIGMIVTLGVLSLFNDQSFPGKITTPNYKGIVDGNKTTFEKGIIYRYPDMVPLLEVTGNHYEMGLQYGVLLRPEILYSLKMYESIIELSAKEANLSKATMYTLLKKRAKELAKYLPDRYLEQIKGISEGSGIPQDTILTISLLYDIGESFKGCTSVLMPGNNESVIHGRVNDSGSEGGIGQQTVVVRYNADGYNSVTHFEPPLVLGVETGYNDKGITFSEETLKLKHNKDNGMSIIYLARMILEEVGTLDELPAYFDAYPVIGGYGTVWSDRDTGEGLIAELIGDQWSSQRFDHSIVWNLNRIYDEDLYAYQEEKVSIRSYNWDRDILASDFQVKSMYEAEDAVLFLRSRIAPDGEDFSISGSRAAICNIETQQMMVFDPQGDGVYLSNAKYFAACSPVYHIFDDFSRTPEVFMDRDPLSQELMEAAEFLIKDGHDEEKLAALIDLGNKYPRNPYISFKIAGESILQNRMDLWQSYSDKAYKLETDNEEYQLYAGIAAIYKGELEEALYLLENLDLEDYSPYHQILRLTALEHIYASTSNKKMVSYHNQKNEILIKYQVADYYDKSIVPFFEKVLP